MKKALLNVIGNTKTLTLTGENDQEYTVTWDSETPEGKIFNGLSFTKNGKVAKLHFFMPVPGDPYPAAVGPVEYIGWIKQII